MPDSVVDTGRTDKLADYNSLGTVYNKGSGLGHKRQIAHENIMLLDVLILFAVQAHFNKERS